MRSATALRLLLWIAFVAIAGVARGSEPPLSVVAVQAPAGGHAVTLPDGWVGCAPAAGEWAVEAEGHMLRPPSAETAVGHVASLKVASTAAACGSSQTTIQLLATGKLPSLDVSSVTLSVDDGRLDVRGRGLRGAGVHWQQGDRGGDDRCVQPEVAPGAGGLEKCSLRVARGQAADGSGATLTLFPDGGRVPTTDVATFDATGRRVTAAELVIRPARFLVSTLVPANVSVDLAGESSRVPLTHPEAVASADCGTANCEIDGSTVVVRSMKNLGQTLQMRLRLQPHVAFVKGETTDAAPTFQIGVLPCSMSIASGDALREVDDSSVVVKLDARCAAEAPTLRFAVGTQPARVLQIVQDGGAAFVLLRIGRIEGSEIAVNALRGDSDGSVVGVARVATRSAPKPRATVEIATGAAIDFIPTNRDALVRFAGAGDHARLVLLPLEGVYDVVATPSGTAIRGVKGAAGFVPLRFGYRAEGLPAALASADLAVITDAIELPIREANVPAAIGASAETSNEPLVEMICGDGNSGTIVIKPGTTVHIPYAARDTCRLVFHRERIPLEDGAQRLDLVIDVARIDGEARPDGHVAQPMVLRPGGQPRYAYIKGVKGQFDRVTVRLSQANDESHYAGTGELRLEAPSVQWSVIVGQGHARIYATTAIPTGLYRVSDRAHSGILTLNFGAIGRLTWLDSDGHDGFLGLEAGVMAVGLPNDVSTTGAPLTQVATVCGLGLSVPIANRSLATETSINLHAWGEYEISRDIGQEPGNPFGFVFGPSISIGNVGANL